MRQPTFFMAFDYDYTGNPALLDRRKVAFFASRVVSPAVEEQALRWAEACCATDRVVISGFQSPLEKSVFELLLKARHPVIWALGRTLYRRYPPAVEEALAEQRILIFAVHNARQTGWQTAQTRNYTIASMSEESVYALRTDGRPSTLDVLCGLELGRKPVCCF
jgi:predicted Rossmann fold nucleotide-binding protein DprA/Smf involved in DNA uptake